MDTIKMNTSVLIIGAGAAGAKSAIELMKNGVEPLVVSKRDLGDAHTTWARGGINASLGNLDPEDSWEIHAADTLDEGHFINDPEAVIEVCKNMPDVITELNEWGMELNKTEDGLIDQRYFGAQSFRRTCFAGDYTGESLLNALVSKAQDLEIPYEDDIYITKILTEDNEAYGAVGLDISSGDLVVIYADKVVIAAGGYTSVYNRHSSRDLENTGDGAGLAYEAGAELKDMEFIQFHPTGMVGDRYGEDWDGRLVTEAVRGEGGRLYNNEGERFMKKYSPKQMELDARDVVARAIEEEIRAGRGTEHGGVYLDISHKDEEFIKERLPRMYERFQSLDVDISEEPMEVAPTAHYAMGGVEFNPKTGETSVQDLHVLGESTAGVHGANRLGGNSLAETVSIGTVVGQYIANQNPTPPSYNKAEQIENEKQRMLNIADNSGSYNPEELIAKLRVIMENYAGIRRNKELLEKGLQEIENIEEKYRKELSIEDELTSIQMEKANNLKFMIIVAKATIYGAIHREESRGAHFRTDHTEKDKNYRLNLIQDKYNDELQLQTKQVKDIPKDIQKVVDEEHELDYHHLE